MKEDTIEKVALERDTSLIRALEATTGKARNDFFSVRMIQVRVSRFLGSFRWLWRTNSRRQSA